MGALRTHLSKTISTLSILLSGVALSAPAVAKQPSELPFTLFGDFENKAWVQSHLKSDEFKPLLTHPKASKSNFEIVILTGAEHLRASQSEAPNLHFCFAQVGLAPRQKGTDSFMPEKRFVTFTPLLSKEDFKAEWKEKCQQASIKSALGKLLSSDLDYLFFVLEK